MYVHTELTYYLSETINIFAGFQMKTGMTSSQKRS